MISLVGLAVTAARADGLTSLAVVAGAAGIELGFRLADPTVGLLITVAILFVLRIAVRDIYRRRRPAPAAVRTAETGVHDDCMNFARC